jgi:hypothetical protein
VSQDASRQVAYFREPEIAKNLSLIAVPSVLTAVMMAMPMPAAINAYSMAVAPDSSRTNFATKPFIVMLPKSLISSMALLPI